MQESEYIDGDRNMRWRLCEQTIRFWRLSKEKDQRDSLSIGEDLRNVRPQDDRSEQRAILSDTQ
jgi:hypothetical protein